LFGIAEKPDISLRKRKIKSIEKNNHMIELEKIFGKKDKGNSLEDIANHLKSTHNNQSLKSFLVKRKDKDRERKRRNQDLGEENDEK